ncbi:PsiF family protein [Leptospira sp. SA-E8]|uniref:PsiF family protein n=1 Tax=Leptospira sp. SA-E8 TaxID=3422259 RepID=UPI003EBBFBD9
MLESTAVVFSSTVYFHQLTSIGFIMNALAFSSPKWIARGACAAGLALGLLGAAAQAQTSTQGAAATSPAKTASAAPAAKPAPKEEPGTKNPQNERMKRCNADAKKQGLKGDERKEFMSECLSGKQDGKAQKK